MHAHVTLTPSRAEVAANASATIGDFPITAPAANPVFYRTYSRRTPTGRESWDQVSRRNLTGLQNLGALSADEVALMARMQAERRRCLQDAGCGSAGPPGLNSLKISPAPTTAHPQI